MKDFILVFIATTIADILWARYGLAVAARAVAPAAAWSIGIVLLGAFTVSEYTTNHWLIIPAALGAGLGTVWGLKFGMPEKPVNTIPELRELMADEVVRKIAPYDVPQNLDGGGKYE